jgi:putative drug exporter of the RND superfamily
VFAVWLAAIVLSAGPLDLVGKFSDAEQNESTSFLPGDAESTRALEASERFTDGEIATIVAVYRRGGGLTPADRRRIAADRAALNRMELPNTTAFGEPVSAPDGAAAILLADITADGEAETIIDPVDAVRERISDPGGGLEVKVTGPAGFSADAIKVFEAIDGTLVLAAISLVFLLLALIYRSPLFLWIPLGAVVFAEIATRAIGFGLTELGVTVNGQSSAILSVLVLGAGTDYALLLVARYREELRRHQDKHHAIRLALQTAGPAIIASGLTVIAALLCLALAEVNGTAGLGPIGAVGIAVAMLSMLTLLPAMLAIFGRRAFWPFVPYGPDGPGAPDAPGRRRPRTRSGLLRLARLVPVGAIGLAIALAQDASPAVAGGLGLTVALAAFAVGLAWHRLDGAVLTPLERRLAPEAPADATHGAWRRLGDRIALAPRRVWAGALAGLVIMAFGVLNFDAGLTQGNAFRGDVESVAGQELVSQSFPGGTNAPTEVVVPDPGDAPAVARAVAEAPGVAEVRPASRGEPGVLLNAVLLPEPYTTEAFDLIPGIRAAARSAGGEEVLVGGASAVEYDLRRAAERDTKLIMPIALVVVFLILLGLLRALVAPLLLILTVIVSFAAALGVGAVVFDVIFGFPGSDPSLPLFAFIFLVALGVDYNIFLMARVREETGRHGTREGMLRGLAVTGGVITSAGIVLAGTFSVLAVMPLVFLTEIGFVIAFGVLLDTFLVRSILVPALVLDIGPPVWWPSSLRRAWPGAREGKRLRAPAGSGRAPTA